MSKVILNSVHESLNEEKWTRATLNSYSINNFKDLDEVIKQVIGAEIEIEVRELCEEHLRHSKNSIIALYIAGIIALSRQLVDDSNLILLINIFSDNHKWNIVEYLANRILEYGENKFALKTLARCYENSNEEAKKFQVWERLIRVDYDEAEIVKLLAEKMEEDGELEAAVEYYKKALQRFVNKKAFSDVRYIWSKLVDYSPEDIDFFFRVVKKVASTLSGERSAVLLHMLYPIYKEKEDWETTITLLKRILEYEPKNVEARRELIECYKNKYDNHSHLDEYIRISNLNQNWRNVHDAINDFEKHIAFDKGNYVYHRSWGIGRIKDMQDDVFVIDFAGRRGHEMSLKMAVSALTILLNDHIWVLKGTNKKEELKERVLAEPSWALKTIIKSFDNSADMKMVKAELVPFILSPGEWPKWATEARKILKTDPAFGNLPDKREQFVVHDTPISFAEKTYNRFKSDKNFFDRVRTIQDFLQEEEPDSEYFDDMFSYFTAFAKAFTTVSELVVSSYLLVQKITAVSPYINPGIEYDFKSLFGQIEDLPELFSNIEDTDLRKQFLISTKRAIPEWPKIFSRLFRYYQSKFIIDELANAGKLRLAGQKHN
jgi:transcription elongation factor GreA-like protein